MADGTQFLIELAAKFAGGEDAVSTLATLGDRMVKAGASAQDLERATKATASALEAAAEAAKLSGDMLGVSETKYREAEISAEKAAKSVERLGQKSEELQGKLSKAIGAGDDGAASRLRARLDELTDTEGAAASKASALAMALKREAAALDLVKAKAEEASAKHAGLTKGLANVKTAADQMAKVSAAAKGTGKVNEMAEAFGKLGGPAGVAGQKVLSFATGFKKLGTAMGSAGPYIGIGVAILAIASAAAIATIAIAGWAVGLADAGRTQGLLSAGIAKSVQGGAELEATITKLGSMVPQTSDELRSMAADLAKTGLRGKDLTDELEAAAIRAAELKWGPDFAKQMLALEVQSRKFGTNISGVFGKLNIEKLLGGISTLVDLFDSTTASGKTMKFLFETMFQPLVDGAGDVIPMIERMFLHAEIWALKAYIAMKPYRGEIELFGRALLLGAAVIGGVLAVALGLVIGLFGLLFVIVLDVANKIYQLVGAFVEVEKAIFGGLGGAVTWLGNLGSDMIKGLVAGITGGAAAVVGAISDTITGGIKAAKRLLMSGSPSKVFAGLGGDTAQGFAEGVEGGASDTQGALEAMVSPPSVPAAGAPGAAGGGGLSLSIGTIVVGGETAKEQALDFIEQITQWLESSSITVGGGEVPGHA